jgi:4-amino-4-deoxy-L-arabinose transferase-like glycosyltransferase
VLIGMVGLGLRFVGLDTLQLIGDESYYWLWSRHPDWAYYDHPAGVALLVRGSTALGGTSPFGVRWLNALIGAGAILLTWLVARQLLSRRAGLFSAAAVAMGAPYLVTSRFVYTNALALFLALLNLLAFWRMARAEAGVGEGLAFGVTLALLFNTKYSGYVHSAALGAALLLDHRHLLRTRRLWLATGIGVLGLVPVVVWNAGHDWASFRWQLTHLTRGAVAGGSMLGNLHHAWVYLTGPLILLGAAGLGRMRAAGERLLTLVALFLLVPVVASPVNSPRNMSTGLVPLLMLAGSRLPGDLTTWSRRMVAAGLASLLVAAAIFGIGTVVGLGGPSPLPQSSIVPAIRRDAAGWPALGEALKGGDEPIFALDYSIAGQIAFYAERPAYTAWGQYRIWGIPSLEDTTVVALDYLDPELVTGCLREAFQQVDEPEHFVFNERGATKVAYIWRAYGLRLEQETFLRRFDFLTMLGEAG